MDLYFACSLKPRFGDSHFCKDCRCEELSLTGIQWIAILDAMYFTEANSGLVSDAHVRARKAIKKMLREKHKRRV